MAKGEKHAISFLRFEVLREQEGEEEKKIE